MRCPGRRDDTGPRLFGSRRAAGAPARRRGEEEYGLLSVVDAAPPGSGEVGLALGASQRAQARTAADALGAYAKKLERAEARRVAAAKRWGCAAFRCALPRLPGRSRS